MAPVLRRALLRRIEHELELAAAVPELAWPPGSPAVLAIAGAEAAPIAERLRPARFDALADERAHAIAALEARRFARAIEGSDEAAIEASATALVRAWAALGARRAYLEAIAAPIVGPAARAPELTARIGIERVALASLVRATEGRAIGGLLRALRESEPLGGEIATRASRARLEALDAVLDPLRRTLDELATRRPSDDELVAAFAAVAAAWERADHDVELEALAVERIADFAWDLYRDRRLVELARLVAEIAPLADSLGARIGRGEALAWAAPCAQVLVFRAELAPRFDAQIALAERAYAVCPTLRNARLVLGDFLLTRAERAIERGSERARAEEDVARAERLHPELKRLAHVRALLSRRSGAK